MSRVIAIIHGTGRTEQDFWIPQTHAIAQHLEAAPRVHPVWWGDLIDAGAHVSTVSDRAVARLHALAQRWPGRPARSAPRLVSSAARELHGVINGVAGVVAYFFPSQKQEVIRNRLRGTLAELTRHNREIVLISESLGCLIAFDVLRAEAHRYNIAVWITMGCPLRTLVRTGQRRRDLGAINPQTIGQWLNLYAPLDPVAAPIASVFPAYPIRDERIDGARGRREAHHYWPNPRATALIAHALRGQV